MTIWRAQDSLAQEGGWCVAGAPDSFSTRDKHAPNPVLRPIISETPNDGETVVGLAGWLEEFHFGPFDQVTCEGSVISTKGRFTVRVFGKDVISLHEVVDDLFHALDVFTNGIENARRVARDKKQRMGVFEGKESTYYELARPAFFMEMTERGAQRMIKETDEQWRRENYADWGSW